jgi:hypothetical protein
MGKYGEKNGSRYFSGQYIAQTNLLMFLSVLR